MIALESPWADIFILGSRVLGFGFVLGACCSRIISFAGLAALLFAMMVAFYPVVSGGALDFGALAVSDGPKTGGPIMLSLAAQFAVGLTLGLPAAGALLIARLVASWANVLAGEGRQRGFEHAVLLLCILSMSPFFSSFFSFFAEGFAGFPFKTEQTTLPSALWELVIGAGKMAFAVSFLILLPSFVLLIGFGLCLFLFQRAFPALLDDGATRAVLAPCLFLSLAFGMYRFSIFCAASAEESLRPSAVAELGKFGSGGANVE